MFQVQQLRVNKFGGMITLFERGIITQESIDKLQAHLNLVKETYPTNSEITSQVILFLLLLIKEAESVERN